ncbi:MAG: hypothetical protein R3287_14500, partial [Anderseniella sp.]|nr:hypothetical protein [Anderseniella sp.]
LYENIIHLDREESRLKAMRHRARLEQDTAETALPELADAGVPLLRKMVLAMAVGRYGYHPEKGGQSAITDICNDLQAAGIDMSQDTVREMLEQASACFPGAADVA